jgi:hypothetical protein
MFPTFEAMKKELTNDQILHVVNQFMKERSKRASYHKKYNTARKEMARAFEKIAEERGISVEDLLNEV